MKLLLVATLLTLFAHQQSAVEIADLMALDKAREATKTALENQVGLSVWLPEVLSELDKLDPTVEPDDSSFEITSDLDRNFIQLMCSELMDNLQTFQGTPLEAHVIRQFAACTDTEMVKHLSPNEIMEIKTQLRLILFTKGVPLFLMFLKPALEWIFK